MTLRYDIHQLKATLTADGYLVDQQAIIARTGVQLYQNADGTVRRELRMPEEVFHPDSLASFAGKPLTDDHPPEAVSAVNFKKYAIGVVTGAAYADGDHVRAPIILHDGTAVDKALRGGKRDLSVGYTVTLDETPGIWNGEKYDAIQRSIRANHLSLVHHGRAGVARLNLDSGDAVSDSFFIGAAMGEKTLVALKLDNGLTYDAAPEVAVAFEALRTRLAEIQAGMQTAQQQVVAEKARADAATAIADTLKQEVEKIPQLKQDMLTEARAQVAARTALEAAVAGFNIDCTGKTDTEVKKLVILAVRKDAELEGKSDDYVQAAFDMTLALQTDVATAAQRLAGTQVPRGDGNKDQGGNYKSFMNDLSTIGQTGKE